jgi:hypothetical protein
VKVRKRTQRKKTKKFFKDFEKVALSRVTYPGKNEKEFSR